MGKVRGRRSQNKEKKEVESFDQKEDNYVEKNDFLNKSGSNDDASDNSDEEDNANADANEGPVSRKKENHNSQESFFGLVDRNEMTYFHQCEQTLNVDTFGSPEEKKMFVKSIFQEARGKELKLVTNKICSKLMERLILNSNLKQIQQLFNALNGRFYELSTQRYSSHVIETFLVKCAALIEKEILSNGAANLDEENDDSDDDEEEEDEAWVSMENMFLFVMGDFKKNLKNMMKDKYASHVFRLSLLVITGKELPSSIQSNSILRSKKSKIARKMIEIKDSEDYQKKFQVPNSFKDELREVLKEITNGETTESLREYSLDSITSPVIQLLIQLEGIVDRDRTIWSRIFNGDNENIDKKEREKEGSFVEYLLSDKVGSHFFQNAIENQKVKAIERLYNSYMKDRIVKLAKRENTGIYVVEKMMEKLKSKQQIEILDELIPILNELIVNNLDIANKIIDCSVSNDNYKREEIIAKFVDFFNKGTTDENLFENILKLSSSTLYSKKDDWPTAEERRRALFLEKLIDYDTEKVLKVCVDNLMKFDNETLIKFCKHGVFSHVVESVLAKRDCLTLVERKTILNKFFEEPSNIVDLACNSTGSHVIDKFWMFTLKLNMYKERIARSLFDHADAVKSTVYGRMVWKNWKMELYCRKFNDWKWDVKEEEKIFDEEQKRKKAEESENNVENINSNVHDRKRKMDYNNSHSSYDNHTSQSQQFDAPKNKKQRGRGRR